MSALGQKQTSGSERCPLYPQKRTSHDVGEMRERGVIAIQHR